MKIHNYEIRVEWTGNLGKGTLDYKAFNRDHIVSGENKAAQIQGSSDPSFLGDNKRYNPEELLVSSISSCHMLWYLHLCAVNKIVVLSYMDKATGVMEETKNGSGKFKEVTLNPQITLENIEMKEKAEELHTEANKMCFIANSCNFPIQHRPQFNIIN
ncbi:organic hydroperoxide reductase OsmC/OhrA [Gillisia mitskevichiae]|uniref:Organic hydroperoxide reductase OsmC/OhrA n=1 Tax=Gillisia mitskevichiae TaxID=270921 RepID=A0A495PWN8_9FLAO|nr:OsmC family protein [Gillisia mitskevichiae]RKS55565.1 organic hydroperoxide reductase OsmC/OhrA [Gillisia mitskevichiae]